MIVTGAVARSEAWHASGPEFDPNVPHIPPVWS